MQARHAWRQALRCLCSFPSAHTAPPAGIITGLERTAAGLLPAGKTAKPESSQDRDLPVYNLDKEVVGTCTLPGRIFDVAVRKDILHRVVRWQLAKRRQGTHAVKTRAQVRGGGRKPWPQKGTGRARAGSIRIPQFRGGGVAHGPVSRSHEHKLNKKVRRLGVLCALSAKAQEGRLTLVDTLWRDDPKTALLDRGLNTLLTPSDADKRSVLLIDTSKDGGDGGSALRRACANLFKADRPGSLLSR
ncbi:hypothetical protein WJX73_010076 [Symbiochloris irregularis]|uniref:Large ribosomal subunit protein uL4m n=1 Tax=Symbiochloris irregularis TaxID=706552 RepID=A0AAW1NSR1_9CHLO